MADLILYLLDFDDFGALYSMICCSESESNFFLVWERERGMVLHSDLSVCR